MDALCELPFPSAILLFIDSFICLFVDLLSCHDNVRHPYFDIIFFVVGFIDHISLALVSYRNNANKHRHSMERFGMTY